MNANKQRNLTWFILAHFLFLPVLYAIADWHWYASLNDLLSMFDQFILFW